MTKQRTYKCTKCDQKITLFITPTEEPQHYHERLRKSYTMKEVER